MLSTIYRLRLAVLPCVMLAVSCGSSPSAPSALASPGGQAMAAASEPSDPPATWDIVTQGALGRMVTRPWNLPDDPSDERSDNQGDDSPEAPR